VSDIPLLTMEPAPPKTNTKKTEAFQDLIKGSLKQRSQGDGGFSEGDGIDAHIKEMAGISGMMMNRQNKQGLTLFPFSVLIRGY